MASRNKILAIFYPYTFSHNQGQKHVWRGPRPHGASASVTGRNRCSAANGEFVPGADSCAVASYVQWLRICHAIELQRLPRARPKPGNHEGVPHRTHARSIAFQWRYRLGYEI
jgi:hypothetical protein